MSSLPAIRAEKHDFARLGAHAYVLQHVAQRHARESPAGGESLEETAAVAGAFVAIHQVRGFHGLEIGQRKFGGLAHQPVSFSR